jgi:site-specific recombinase XerC
MKGKTMGRSMGLHRDAQAAISAWLQVMPDPKTPETYLFRSRAGDNQPLRRVQAWQILHEAYATNQLQGRLGTHSLRKTFARRLYGKTHDLKAVQHLLGHAYSSTTDRYLATLADEVLWALVRSL